MKSHVTIATCLANLAGFCAAAAVTSAFAQPPVAPLPALLKSTCVKPELPDRSRRIIQARMDALISESKVYKECVAAFALEQKTRSEQQQQAAQASIALANAAIKEYNEFIEASNKATNTSQDGKKDDKKP